MIRSAFHGGPTLHQLRCFAAVAEHGGFQAAAEFLNRTHPTVFTAVRALEEQLGFPLFDRSGYRVSLTDRGRAFHERVRGFLADAGRLQHYAAHLAAGAEASIAVVIGDACPLAQTLGILNRFFADCPDTRLDLHFETLSGPAERLLDGEADLIFHPIDKSDLRFEFIDLCPVRFIPVVAPGFLDFAIGDRITPEAMAPYAQCIIRDTARRLSRQSHYIVEGARQWTVGDQLTKKEIILQGMAWGHLPSFLIADELRDGRLISIEGRHLRGGSVALTAARLRQRARGPVAARLWQHIEDHGFQEIDPA